MVVNYENQDDLRYSLQGIDLVISTVSGNPQINLIDAAANSGVRRFVPSEFERPPARRRPNNLLDRDKSHGLDWLRWWSQRTHMRSTVFTCGVFYERFARGGLVSMGIGASTSVAYQGSYLVDIGEGTAEAVEYNMAGQPIFVSMTSVNDVARFLVAAIELGLHDWPGEFRMSGDRRTVSEILSWSEAVRGGRSLSTASKAGALIESHRGSIFDQHHQGAGSEHPSQPRY